MCNSNLKLKPSTGAGLLRSFFAISNLLRNKQQQKNHRSQLALAKVSNTIAVDSS